MLPHLPGTLKALHHPAPLRTFLHHPFTAEAVARPRCTGDDVAPPPFLDDYFALHPCISEVFIQFLCSAEDVIPSGPHLSQGSGQLQFFCPGVLDTPMTQLQGVSVMNSSSHLILLLLLAIGLSSYCVMVPDSDLCWWPLLGTVPDYDLCWSLDDSNCIYFFITNISAILLYSFTAPFDAVEQVSSGCRLVYDSYQKRQCYSLTLNSWHRSAGRHAS